MTRTIGMFFLSLTFGLACGLSASAQRTALLPGLSLNLDQCANGSNGATVCSGSAWQNGNLNSSQASYIEGQSVPYRIKIGGLTVGSQTTLTIEWDTTQNGKDAIDYLRTYNVSATGADACTDFLGAGNCGTSSTYAIPVDSNVTKGPDGTLGSSDDITQKAGVFTLWGGTIDSVSGYTLSGTYAGSSSTSIDITFTPSSVDAVLAWSGHIATRDDWGLGRSAGSINGSPYHMRSITGGNQDRSLQTSVITYIGRVTVIKVALPLNGGTTSSHQFGFNSSIPMGSSIPGTTLTGEATSTDSLINGFQLVDNGTTADSTTTATTIFGTNITVDETGYNGWTLNSMNCVSSDGMSANNITGASYNTTLTLASGEYVTCTSTSSQFSPTAARVAVGGTVVSRSGAAIKNATVTLTNSQTGESLIAKSNGFGNFVVNGVAAGASYVISASHQRFTFSGSTQMLSVTDAVEGLRIVSDR